MLTQTLLQMERHGRITRTVHPVVPPKVEYELTGLGFSNPDVAQEEGELQQAALACFS